MSRLLRTVSLGLAGYLLAGGCMDATGSGGFSVLPNLSLTNLLNLQGLLGS